MPLLRLRALDCVSTEDWTKADSCRLEIAVDGRSPTKREQALDNGQRWLLDLSFSFQNKVEITLWDEDFPDADDFLGQVTIGPQLTHRAMQAFKENGADYKLWYEVIPSDANPVRYHRRPIEQRSVRQLFGRMGRGAMTAVQYATAIYQYALYQCTEVISVKDTFAFHAQQDRGKGNTTSLRTWIQRHCNPWGEESVIPLSDLPHAYRIRDIGTGKPNWTAVHDEKSYCVAGFQHFSRRTSEDNPLAHHTTDWNWDQIVHPPIPTCWLTLHGKERLNCPCHIFIMNGKLVQCRCSGGPSGENTSRCGDGISSIAVICQ